MALIGKVLNALYLSLTEDPGLTGELRPSWQVTLYDPATVEDQGVYDSAIAGHDSPVIVFGNAAEKIDRLQGDRIYYVTVHLFIWNMEPDVLKGLDILEQLERVLDQGITLDGYTIIDQSFGVHESKRYTNNTWYVETSITYTIQ